MADYIVIDGNGYTLQGSGSGRGITLTGRSNIIIKNVKITGWFRGINLDTLMEVPSRYSKSNRITENTITANTMGILLNEASNNSIIGNTITNIKGEGIGIDYSHDNTISGNTISNTSVSIHCDWESNNNTITGNTVTDNMNGINIARSSYNQISDNTITNTYGAGIGLSQGSSNNYIHGNTLTNNAEHAKIGGEGAALWFGDSSNNVIYHNNIIDNGKQADDTNAADNDWYHPELLEGNYWSDYPGVDDGSGTDKHAIAGDGIGDTNIPWPGPDYDAYPIVREPETTSILAETTSPETTTPSVPEFILGNGYLAVAIALIVIGKRQRRRPKQT